MASVSQTIAEREAAKRRRIIEILAVWIDGRASDEHVLDQIDAAYQEYGSPPAYSAPVTIPVHAIAEAYSHGATGWQILDAKDEQTWRDLTAVVDCERGKACPNHGDCEVLVSTAWSDGFDHRDGEASMWVRIPAGDR